MRTLLVLLAIIQQDVQDPGARAPIAPWVVLAALAALHRGATVCARPCGCLYSASLWVDDLEAADVVHRGRTLALSALAFA